MKQSVTVGAQLLWGGRYGCNNGRYGCTIVMSYIEINKAASQWLLTFNLCVSVTWPLTCAFHIPCTHTPEIIDMHRGVCDKVQKRPIQVKIYDFLFLCDLTLTDDLEKQQSTSSMPLQSLSIISQPSVKFKLELLSGNAPFGSISVIFVPGDLEVRKMTSKNNRAPLLCYFKLCASFHSQTEVMIGNAQIGSKLVLTSVTLTTDFWPWPFAWTSLL